jgi:hypothetical protein
VRCNNINVTYGYAKQGFQSQANEDGLHSPSILKNKKSKPLVGKQYLLLLNFVAEFDPHEKHYDCSSNLFHAHNKYPQFALESTGHPSPDGAINILENFSEIRNTLDLTHLPENKHEAPCFPHFDEGKFDLLMLSLVQAFSHFRRNHNIAVTSISSLCFLVLSCMAITLPISLICTFCRS